jgi:hypothetical protein
LPASARRAAKKNVKRVRPLRFRLVSPHREFIYRGMSLLLAATTLEKMQAVPTKVWVNVAIGILLFFGIILLIKKAADMNKVVLAAIVFIVLSSVGFNWVYARNEPKFLTPLIDPLARFFPSVEKQAQKEKRAVVP